MNTHQYVVVIEYYDGNQRRESRIYVDAWTAADAITQASLKFLQAPGFRVIEVYPIGG